MKGKEGDGRAPLHARPLVESSHATTGHHALSRLSAGRKRVEVLWGLPILWFPFCPGSAVFSLLCASFLFLFLFLESTAPCMLCSARVCVCVCVCVCVSVEGG